MRRLLLLTLCLMMSCGTRGVYHPPSEEGPLPKSPIKFVWSGALTPTSIRVNTAVKKTVKAVALVVGQKPDLSDAQAGPEQSPAKDSVLHFKRNDLEPGVTYYYGIQLDGVVDTTRIGSFTTPKEGPQSFTFLAASCATTGSNGSVFDVMRQSKPLFFIHMGDLHYENIGVADTTVYADAYERVLASPAQQRLYLTTPIAYIWDDHDYGPNNSDSTNPGREAARLTYQAYTPHYPLVAGSGNVPVYQAFTVGRVRVILTDLRSERVPNTMPEGADKTIMGATQKAWFKEELLKAKENHQLIVWANTSPWIAGPEEGGDRWSGYVTERRELSNFIHHNNITNLVVISGDAHMVAMDDGSHTNYSDQPGKSFPLLHAASLDRYGSIKGGPYSEGAWDGSGQYGQVQIKDDGGSQIHVILSGHNYVKETLVEKEFTFTL